ncbi:MAG TPA: hypothetical protein VM884_05555 [Flavisolibacter sp.]|nr:hypothetical protein [Flavisolibacter sp.]
MQSKDESKEGKATVGYTGVGEGMQGVDKAPGEEPAAGTDNTIRDAQKGKNKVDGDPSKESDQPIDM